MQAMTNTLTNFRILVHAAHRISGDCFNHRLSPFHVLAAGAGDVLIRNAFALNKIEKPKQGGERLCFEGIRRHCVKASNNPSVPSVAQATYKIDRFHEAGKRNPSIIRFDQPFQVIAVKEPELLLIAAAIARPVINDLSYGNNFCRTLQRKWLLPLQAAGLYTGAMECKTALEKSKDCVSFCANTMPLNEVETVRLAQRHAVLLKPATTFIP